MALWINHVAIAAPRNGTTTHTVAANSGTVVVGSLFTPTSGSLLVVVVEGAVTSTTPSGYTLRQSAINNSGLYVWSKTATGSDGVTTTHNGSNYPVVFHFFEFAAGSTWVNSATATNVNPAGGANPAVTGLTGTNLHMFVLGHANAGGTSPTVTWSTGTELVDTSLPLSVTDGYVYSLMYVEDSVASTTGTPTATLSASIGGTQERITFVVNVAAPWAEYGFTEGSGTTTADSSGNGRNRTFSGTWAATAKTNSGLGQGARSVGAVGPNQSQSTFTIMGWVKSSLPSAGTYVGILSSAAARANGIYFEFSPFGSALLLDYSPGTGSVLDATSTFPVNTATHVAVVVNGTSVALFINGTAAGTMTAGSSAAANFSATDFTIGNSATLGESGPVAAGDWIDEVRVFPLALSASDIAAWSAVPVGSAGATNFNGAVSLAAAAAVTAAGTRSLQPPILIMQTRRSY